MTEPMPDPKADLHRYLRRGRNALLWKLEGLSEYDVRRPMTPTGTNLLGLVKHVASVELGYLGDTFGRPLDEPMPWMDDEAEANADMYATVDESRDDIVAMFRRVNAHADATIDALELDAVGHVPWWGEHGTVSLHRILVHMLSELQRHTGQADIVRELIDGQAGLSVGNTNLPDGDTQWWTGYRARVEQVARAAAGT